MTTEPISTAPEPAPEITPPRMEAPYMTSFNRWKTSADPLDLHETVKHLQPAISGTLRSMGASDDATTALKAKILASKAVRTYDPARAASLPTWVNQQLQPLRRYRRLDRSTVRIPEQIQLDAFHLMQKESEFIDKHQRQPDAEELSDFAHMPIRRISDVRRKFRKVVSQTAIGDTPATFSNGQTSDHSDEALGYIYRDADRVDRAIIEMKTGYGGKYDPMTSQEIGIKLRITPVQLSRRSARLGAQVDEIRANLERD